MIRAFSHGNTLAEPPAWPILRLEFFREVEARNQSTVRGEKWLTGAGDADSEVGAIGRRSRAISRSDLARNEFLDRRPPRAC